MDTPKPPQKPIHLLDDLESIREFLSNNEPASTANPDEYLDLPLLTDSVEMGQIPLLSDIVAAPPALPPSQPSPSAPVAPAHTPAPAKPEPPQGLAQTVQRSVEANTSSDLLRLDGELRAAAQLILQDVIDDFVPQIEAELKRRLEARLTRLLPPRKV